MTARSDLRRSARRASRPALLGLLAIVASVGLVACAAPAAALAPPEGDGPVVAFYGDSYTLGTGASDPALRWSTVISEERGWREYNPSVNGLGYINNRSTFGDGDLPDLIIEQQPDIVFVTMGLNDNFSYDRVGERIQEQMNDDIDILVEALPEARFIVVEPFWYTDERPESVEVIIRWQREMAERIDADYIEGASRWIEGRPELMASDGLHPDDDGYAVMTERMRAELEALGL
ncbi:SGNH/GDSL hydrolase family protein [Microcella flavibacter]|uniref:SGNH/GDSL hydrolase family protein n=1 Tax=Microcella flavibacter TaxID=1804990 RepID=UPI0014575B81|nr:SGNH/GDSL hydrolase family protein [Microcella flavibacter]